VREFQEITANEASEGLSDDDPMLWDREDEEESFSFSEGAMRQLLETYVGKKLMATGLLIGWKIITMNKGFSAHYPGGLVAQLTFSSSYLMMK